MAEDPIHELKLDNEDAATPTKINRKPPRKLHDFVGHSVDNPSLRAKRYEGALLAVRKPSYCLKRGIGSLRSGGESHRFQHRTRLFRLLRRLLSQHNWAEASGVLSVLLQGTVKDPSISGNRAKYTAALDLLSVIKGENFSSRRMQSVYELWMKKIGPLNFWSRKIRFAVQVEFILNCLQRGSTDDAYQASLCLMQERGFNDDPVGNLVIGLTFYQLWYTGLPKELLFTEFDSSLSHTQSEIPIETIRAPIAYSKEDNSHAVGGRCSNTSVAKDKDVAEDSSDQNKNSMDIEANVKKETSCSSHEPQGSCEKSEPIGVSGSSFSDRSDDVPRASIYQTQGLPPWLLPMKLRIPDESLEEAAYMHRTLLNSYYKSAVKHLRVALRATPPVIEALHPLIQMLILGDQVDEALDELESLPQSLDTILQLRLQESLLEHFDNGNYVKLCTCFEDILKKDPTCGDSLSRLVVMHQRGDYDTQSLVEMIALHLDASYGTCDTWHEFASCLLKLSQCEGDRESACYSGSDPDSQNCSYASYRIPELFTHGESRKSWRLRFRWWLNRHFHHRILDSDTASDLKLLTYKAAAASHIYGRRFEYVVKTTETLERENDMKLYSFLQTHVLNSLGFCIVEGRS